MKELPHQDIVSKIRDVSLFVDRTRSYSIYDREAIWIRFYQFIHYCHATAGMSIEQLESSKHTIAYLAESNFHEHQ